MKKEKKRLFSRLRKALYKWVDDPWLETYIHNNYKRRKRNRKYEQTKY